MLTFIDRTDATSAILNVNALPATGGGNDLMAAAWAIAFIYVGCLLLRALARLVGSQGSELGMERSKTKRDLGRAVVAVVALAALPVIQVILVST